MSLVHVYMGRVWDFIFGYIAIGSEKFRVRNLVREI
jgi:hypothetical protein